MRSGHGKARVARIVCAFAVVWGLALPADAAPLRVVCFDPGDRELQARVEGQTRDLPLRLVWIAPYLGRLPSAPELEQTAKEQGASVVVSLEGSASGGMTVHVYDAVRRRLRTRRVPAPPNPGRLAASTVAETAALIIRGELRAALSGGVEPDEAASDEEANSEGGVSSSNGAAQELAAARGEADPAASVPQAADEPEAPSDGTLDADADSDPAEAPDPSPGRAPARPDRVFSLALGGRASAPGAGLLLGGAWLGARVEFSGFELGLGASSTLPAELENEAVRVSLRRHAIGADLLALAVSGAELELWLGLSGGVVLHTRRASTLDEVRETTPNHTSVGAVFAPLAELRWRFTHNLGISVRAGLDLLPSVPRFTYERSAAMGQRDELAALRAFEPFISVALFASTWERGTARAAEK